MLVKRYHKFETGLGVISQYQIKGGSVIESIYDADGNEITHYQYTDLSGYITLYGKDLDSIVVELVD